MELTVLKDIVIIFALSTIVNLIFTKIKIPTVVGYLITGIIAGPYVLSLIKGLHEIELMAEIGVILLLFTIGMEFSLKHLVKIRRIVFLGGFIQVFITAFIFYTLAFFFDLNWKEGLFIGFLAALSSSALVLKLLQERSELTSNYGRTVLGILIFQDLLLVPLLLFTNILGDNSVDIGNEIVLIGLKTIFIIGVVYVGNKWVLPKLLQVIAMTKNQELFMMSIFLICLAIALLTSKLGMSLAFGAFLAGLMISESEYIHNAFGSLITFKDTFTSFFFVSIGMLLDVSYLINNYQLVLASVLIVLVLKTIIAGGTGFILGHTFRGTVVVGLALSQVGEFSFILAKIGFSNGILSNSYYQLFLSVAVITMALTPFLMNLSLPIANTLLKLPLPNFLVNGLFPLKEVAIANLKNHIVIIGKDTCALKLSYMAKYNKMPHVSIIFDPIIAKERIEKGETVVYGDAVNEPILMKAHVDSAEIIVISVGNIIPAMAIIEKVRNINKTGYILVRAKHSENVEQLYKLGVDQVFPEKLEIAIDLFKRILIKRQFPQKDMNSILKTIRNLTLGIFMKKDTLNQLSILDEFSDVSVSTINLDNDSLAVGKSIIELDLRKITGVTLIALRRGEEIIEHPLPETKFQRNDIAYILGNQEQIKLASKLFNGES
ncbi:MAG: cation:proton antiporter [Prolixibacteraceae bacterium]|jgi:CPA2 family monovalent cation:H+ antiporter-2|nr:cation:proton antiporter [Prolixibacteraceae bacterium]